MLTTRKRFCKVASAIATAVGIAGAAFCTTASAETALPPLPAAIKDAGVLRAGVRCDQPPYGFKDEKGNFAGIETEMALQIATWAFGSPDKIELTCVTAENRIPQLNGKKVDLLPRRSGLPTTCPRSRRSSSTPLRMPCRL